MANEINDIIIALKAQGFDDFARKAKLPVAGINALADAMLQSGSRSAKALDKFRKTQEDIGNLTRAQSIQLSQAIKAYDKYLRKLSEQPTKRAQFGDDLSTVIRQTKAAIAAREAQIAVDKKAAEAQRAAAEAAKKAKVEQKVVAPQVISTQPAVPKAEDIAKAKAAAEAELNKLRSHIVKETTAPSIVKSPVPIATDLFKSNREALKGAEFDKDRLAISTQIISKLTEQLTKENAVNTSLASRQAVLKNIQEITKQSQAFLSDAVQNKNLDPKSLEAYKAALNSLNASEKDFITTHNALIQTANNKAINKAVTGITPQILADLKNKNVQQIPSVIQAPKGLEGSEFLEARTKAATDLINKINEQIGKENLANKSIAEQALLLQKIQQILGQINQFTGATAANLKLVSPDTLSNLNAAESKLNKIRKDLTDITTQAQAALSSKQLFDSFTKESNELVKNLKNKNLGEDSIASFDTGKLGQLSAQFNDTKFDDQRVKLAADLQAKLNKIFETELAITKTVEAQDKLRAKFAAASQNVAAFGTKGSLDPKSTQASSASIALFEKEVSLSKQKLQASSQLTQQIREQEKAQNELTGADANYQKSIGLAIGKIIRYRAAFFTMRAAIQGATGSIKTFVEIQSELAELSKVIGPTESLEKFRDEAFKMAQTFGGSVNDVVKSFKIWAQAGLKQNEVLKATQATLVGVNAIGLDSLQVTEALTAAIFTYGTAVEDSVKVLSKWLAVEREFPVSAADLANSIKIVGSAGETLGVTLDDLAGFVAAINAATRKSGVAVGQSIKTVFAEIPTKDSIDALEAVGIAVFKTANQFRDLDNIFDDLAVQWNTLSSVQKTNIAITLAGVRRFSDFISLMDNYSIKLKATAIAQRASDEALQAANLQLQTLEKSWQKAKAGIDEFAFSVGQALEGGLATLSNALKSITTSLGGVGDVLPKVAAGLISFISGAVAIGAPLLVGGYLVGTLTRKLREAQLEAKKASASMATFAGATVAANASIKTFSLANLIKAFGSFNLIVTAISVVLGTFATIFALTKKPVYDTVSAFDDLAESAKQSVTVLDDAVASLETQIKLVSQLPAVLDDAVEGYQNAEVGSEGYRKSINRLINSISSVTSSNEEFKKSQTAIQNVLENIIFETKATSQASNEMLSSHEKSTTALEDLVLANKLYKQSLQGLEEELKLSLIRTKELRTEQIALSKEAIKRKLTDLKVQKRSLDFVLSFNDDDLKEASRVLDNTLKDRVVSIRAEFESLLSPNFFKDAKAKFAALRPLQINQFTVPLAFRVQREETRKLVKANLQDMQDGIEETAPKLRKILSTLLADPSAASFLGLDDQTIDQTLGTIDSIIDAVDLLIDRTDKINLDGLNEQQVAEALQEPLAQALHLLDQLENAQKKIDFKFLGESKSSRLQNEMEDLLKIANELGQIANNNTEFVIGVAIGKEAIDAKRSVDKLLSSLNNIGSDLLILQQTAKFGDITPSLDETKFAKLQEFIKNSAEEIKKLDGQISLFEKRTSGLDKFIKAAGKLDKEALNTAAGAETLRVALSDIGDEEVQNDLRSAGDKAAEANKKFKEFDQTLRSLRETKDKLINAKELADSLGILKILNSQFAKNFSIAQLIQIEYEKLNQALLIQQKLLSSIPDSEEKIQALELKRIDLIKRQNLLIAQQADTNEQKVTKSIEAQNQAWQDTQQVLIKIRDLKLDKIFSKIAENANLVRDAISGAIGNIPTNILSGHEKRKELSNQIHNLEIEIQDAQREGNQDAVNDAKQRLDLAKKEMGTYRRGWFEIRNIVLDIFDTISQAFWSGLSKRFGELVSKISLGEDTLGDQVAKSMAVATGNLVSNWESTVSAVNKQFLTDYARLLGDFLKAEEDLKRSQTISLPEIQAVPSTDLEKWPSIALKNVVDRLQVAKIELEKSARGGDGADFIGPILNNPALEDISTQIERLYSVIAEQNLRVVQEDGGGNSVLRNALSMSAKNQSEMFSKTQQEVVSAILSTNKLSQEQSAELIKAIQKFKPSESSQKTLNAIAKTLKVSSTQAKEADKTVQDVVNSSEAIAFSQEDAVKLLEKLQRKELIIPPVDLSSLTEQEREILSTLLESNNLQLDIKDNIAAGTEELSGALNAILFVLSKNDKNDLKGVLTDKQMLDRLKKLNKQTDVITINNKKQDSSPIEIESSVQPVNSTEDFFNKLIALQNKTAPELHLESVEVLPELTAQSNVLLTEIKSILSEQNSVEEKNNKVLNEQSHILQLVKTGLLTLGASLATGLTGTKNKGAQTGAGVGAAVGSALFQTTGKDAAGNVVASGANALMQEVFGQAIGSAIAGPIGAFIGGSLGGLLGGLFGGDEPEEKKLPRALEDNTQAVNNNTLALKQLDKAIFNAPTGFNVPAFAGGAGFGRSITINIQGGDSTEIANKVRKMINNDFRTEANSYGSRGYSR